MTKRLVVALLALITLPLLAVAAAASVQQVASALADMSHADIERALAAAGFQGAQLPERQKETTLLPQVDTATACSTVHMFSTDYVPVDIAEAEAVLREEAARAAKHGGRNSSHAATADAALLQTEESTSIDKAKLDCQCETYKCHCRKQCFCKLGPTPFNGNIIPSKPVTSPMKPGKADNQFKCTCSFDGIGGASMSNGGSMDCDCKIAACTCEKRCICDSVIGAPRFEETAAKLVEDDDGTTAAGAGADTGGSDDLSAAAAAAAAVTGEDGDASAPALNGLLQQSSQHRSKSARSALRAARRAAAAAAATADARLLANGTAEAAADAVPTAGRLPAADAKPPPALPAQAAVAARVEAAEGSQPSALNAAVTAAASRSAIAEEAAATQPPSSDASLLTDGAAEEDVVTEHSLTDALSEGDDASLAAAMHAADSADAHPFGAELPSAP
eukprot:PLAT3553.19.p1 GENE.PLAT3553.19~~PLAT3553.19.p1  ORF type:complete len:448 (-),score=217.04 PLAT3553.19:38-1381(-)